MNSLSTLIFILFHEHVSSKGCPNNFVDRAVSKTARNDFQNRTHVRGQCPLPIPDDPFMPIINENNVFGNKLSNGACISKSYSKGDFPKTFKEIEKSDLNETLIKEDKNCSTTYYKRFKSCGVILDYAFVHTIIKNYTIREIDERKNTVTIDLSLKLIWMDFRIFSHRAKHESEEEKEMGYSISTKAANEIWKPELPVHDLADHKKFKDSFNMISLRIQRKHYIYDDDCIYGPILNYEIDVKPSFYCNFDLSNYPLDKSHCKFRVGGSVSNIAFKLFQQRSERAKTFEISDMTVSASLAEDYENIQTKTSLGLDIEIQRHLKPYLLKYYIPCIMIVLISHLSFIIPLNALPGRVALVVTLFLTLTNLFIQELVSARSIN